jgi:hypothetical protein
MSRFQGRGETQRPNCPKCDSIMRATYIKDNYKWVKIANYCKWCGRFEALVEPEQNKILA